MSPLDKYLILNINLKPSNYKLWTIFNKIILVSQN